MFDQCVQLDRKIPDEASPYAASITDSSWLADMIASTISFPNELRREILLELNPMERINIVNRGLAVELDLLQTENNISERVFSC